MGIVGCATSQTIKYQICLNIYSCHTCSFTASQKDGRWEELGEEASPVQGFTLKKAATKQPVPFVSRVVARVVWWLVKPKESEQNWQRSLFNTEEFLIPRITSVFFSYTLLCLCNGHFNWLVEYYVSKLPAVKRTDSLGHHSWIWLETMVGAAN